MLINWPLFRGYLGSWDMERLLLPLWKGCCCKEVETRVNVWTVHQDKNSDCCRQVAIVERWSLVEVWLYCFQIDSGVILYAKRGRTSSMSCRCRGGCIAKWLGCRTWYLELTGLSLTPATSWSCITWYPSLTPQSHL